MYPSQVSQKNPQAKSVLSKEEANLQRVKIAVDQVVCYVLLRTFEIGAPNKKHDETLEEYLIREKGWGPQRYENEFDPDQKRVIRKDKSCKEFDVSLLYKAIQKGCQRIYPYYFKYDSTLESRLKVIRANRNTVIHCVTPLSDAEFHEKIEEIRKNLMCMLDLVKERYEIRESVIQGMRKHVTLKLDEIRDLPLVNNSLPLEKLKTIVEKEGISDLVKGFKVYSYLNPAAQVAGCNIQIPIDKVYTNLKVISNGRYKINESIDNTNFLQRVELMDTNPGVTLHVIIIEGVAGSGKTTMVKMLINDWLSGKKTGDYKVMTLGNYKFIIPLQCRDTNHSSIKSLISSLMPTARKAFHEEQLMVNCLVEFPTLFIIDGLDEVNLESKKILSEIISLRTQKSATVICTTRPGSIEDCYRMLPDNVNPLHLRIDGVPSNLRESFVRKYHDQLKAMKKSFQNTDELIKFLKTTGARLKDHWTLPLNLTLLSLLWAHNSDKINLITTPAELFEAIHHLIVEKLLERLNYTSKLSIKLPKDRVGVFLSILYREAFFGLHQNNLVLPNEAVSRLVKQCETLELSSHELLGAFLVQRNFWSAMGITFELSFAHKSAQEYYGARYIYGQMFTQEPLIPQTLAQMVMSHFLGNETPANILSEITSLMQKREPRKVKGVSEVLRETFEIESDIEFKDTNKFFNTILLLIGIMKEAGNYDEEQMKSLVEVPFMIDNCIRVTDENLWEMSIITTYNIPEVANVHISSAPTKNKNLENIMNNFEMHEKCSLWSLELEHLFRWPVSNEEPIMNIIKRFLQKRGVKVYTGQMPLSSSIFLEKEMDNICQVSVSLPGIAEAEQFYDLLDQRKELFLKSIRELKINVCNLPANIFRPLPGDAIKDDQGAIQIYIPDVRNGPDVERAVTIVRNLRPTHDRWISGINFPRCGLKTTAELKDVIKRLMKLDWLTYVCVSFPVRCCPDFQNPDRARKRELLKIANEGIQFEVKWDSALDTWE